MSLARLKASKRAQQEIFGLAIVVILLVIGMVFIIQASSKEKAPGQQTFVDSHLPVDLLNAMSVSTTSCLAYDLSGLVEECMLGGRACGESACVILEQDLALVLNEV